MNAQTWNSSTSGNIYYNQGNVAIGKTTPNATLDINGNINFGNGTDATMNFNSSIGSGLYGNGANLRIVPIANNVTQS